MGGATIWPVPRAVDAEAHYYPRKWKRNYLFLYTGLFLTGIQIQRFGHLCRVSIRTTDIQRLTTLTLIYSNRRCALANIWTGEARMRPSVSGTRSFEC